MTNSNKDKETLGGESNSANSDLSLRLGKALKAIRLKRRLTQSQVANSIPVQYGVNQSYLSRVENGDLFPGKDRITAICDVLECKVTEVWSIAEGFEFAGASDKGIQEDHDQLLTCLQHEKLGLEFEDVSSIQEYVDSRISQLSEAIDRLHVGLITNGQVDYRDIDTLKSVASEIVLPAKATQCIVDLLSDLINRSPQVAVIHAGEYCS